MQVLVFLTLLYSQGRRRTLVSSFLAYVSLEITLQEVNTASEARISATW